MKRTFVYYADDGTKFESESECLAYEENMRICLSSIKFYDDELKELINPSIPEIEAANAMLILNGEGAKVAFSFLKKNCCFCIDPDDYRNIKTDDVLLYDKGYWVNIREEINSLTYIQKCIKSKNFMAINV